MSFPPAFLEELRARLPLSGMAAKRLRLVRAGREFKACCPFHNEKTPSFYINDEKRFFHCFGCGAHGDVIGLTMRLDNLSFPEAIERLAAQAGLPVPQDTPVERERFDQEKRLYLLLESAMLWFENQLHAPIGQQAKQYLMGRGLSESSMRRFHLGYAPSQGQALLQALQNQGFSSQDCLAVGLARKNEDRGETFAFFRNRVMFPVGDQRGRTVAFGGRVLYDGEPKYLNSPDHPLFHKGRLLYGLSRARAAVSENQPIVVVEGYMDVIALVEHGFTGALAPLGTALTEDQLATLWRLLPPLEARDPSRDYTPILCFDGDSAGQRAAKRAIARALPLLTDAQSIRIATLPESEDPDSLLRQAGRSGMQAVLDQSKPMIDALWDLTLENRRLQTPEERSALLKALQRNIAAIQDESLRSLYRSEMQKRVAYAFQWDTKHPPSGKSPRTGGTNRARAPYGHAATPRPLGLPAYTPVSKQPPKATPLRERVLLALMVNYPALFVEFGEDLARIAFTDGPMDILRQQIVELLSAQVHEPLDATELYRHLSDGEKAKVWQKALAETISEGTYVHASFARPHRSSEQARKGWKSIWNKYLQELLQVDLQTARRAYAQEGSQASLARLMALRAQVEALMTESATLDPIDSDDEGSGLDATGSRIAQHV